MRYRHLIFFLSLFLLPRVQAEGENALLVWTRDGSVVGYELAVRPQVRLTDTDVVLDAGEVSVSYPLADYVRMSFGQWNFDSVEELPTKGLFRIVGDKLFVSGLKPSEAISVYTVDGMLLWLGKASSEGSATVPFDGHGVRVFRTESIYFKTNRR